MTTDCILLEEELRELIHTLERAALHFSGVAQQIHLLQGKYPDAWTDVEHIRALQDELFHLTHIFRMLNERMKSNWSTNDDQQQFN